MKCPKCGKLNDDEDKFCKGCGTKLAEENANKNSSLTHSNKKTLIICATVVICVIVCLGAFIYINTNSNNTTTNAVNESSSNSNYNFGDYDVRIISGISGDGVNNDAPAYSYQDECNIITGTAEDDDYCFGASNYVSTEIVDGEPNNVREVHVFTSFNVFVGSVDVTVIDANGKSHKVTKQIDSTMQQSFDISVPSGCSIDQIHCYVHN